MEGPEQELDEVLRDPKHNLKQQIDNPNYLGDSFFEDRGEI